MISTEEIRIITIAENSVSGPGFIGEWGFSAFIEAGPYSFLLDTGSSGTTVRNSIRLGVDLGKAETIVLSHGHYDHTGGLRSVLERMKKQSVRIIAHPDVMGSKYSYRKKTGKYRYAGIPFQRELLENLGGRFEFSSDPVWLTDDIAASGEEPMTTDFEKVADNLYVKEGEHYVPDPMNDDQSVYIRTDRGLIVILGCAHRGMINIIRHGQNLMETENVYMVIGGTHLGPAREEQVNRTVEALVELGIGWLGVSHCTGLEVSAHLAREFDGSFFFNSVGTVIQFPFELK